MKGVADVGIRVNEDCNATAYYGLVAKRFIWISE